MFGSQNSDDEDNGVSEDARRSPFTVKGSSLNGKTNGVRRDDERADRKRWKNLRDFVDERAIEDTIEKMENERSALDVSTLGVCARSRALDTNSRIAPNTTGYSSKHCGIPRDDLRDSVRHP